MSAYIPPSELVPLQHAPYNGRNAHRILSSDEAAIKCQDKGLEGLLEVFNRLERVNVRLNDPGVCEVLQSCIHLEYDLGTAYCRLRGIWQEYPPESTLTIASQLMNLEKQGDNMEEARQKALGGLNGETILNPYSLKPRRIWDLCGNRVVPLHFLLRGGPDVWQMCGYDAISHSWTNPMPSIEMPVNNYEWPVPLPPGGALDAIRAELLNLGAEYIWLDVLCLRQYSTLPGEKLRASEWAIDVPTIGNVYTDGATRVIRYFNGLGKAFKRTGWDDSRHWLMRAWTLQEIKFDSVTAGIPSDIEDPLAEKGEDGILLSKKLDSLSVLEVEARVGNVGNDLDSFVRIVAEMRPRVSTNPVDRVAGIGMLLRCPTLPIYRGGCSTEEAWTACVQHLSTNDKRSLLFCYPVPGDGSHKWRVSWRQLMEETDLVPYKAPTLSFFGNQVKVSESGYALYEGPRVRNAQISVLPSSAGKKYRQGRITLVKRGREIEIRMFVPHAHPLVDGTYTLVGSSDLENWIVCTRSEKDSAPVLEKISLIAISESNVEDMEAFVSVGINTFN